MELPATRPIADLKKDFWEQLSTLIKMLGLRSIQVNDIAIPRINKKLTRLLLV